MADKGALELVTSEARRFVVEIIATLVDVKTIAAERLLRPAGLPEEIIRRFLSERNAVTSKKFTKREFSAVILDELDELGLAQVFVDNIVDITARWGDYHLAADEIVARGLQQKAISLRQNLALVRQQAALAEQRRFRESEVQSRREREEASQKQHDLLLLQLDTMQNEAAHRRGCLLEDLLARTFDLHNIEMVRSFRRNDGGEQIHGAFRYDGWHYIVECRWRNESTDMRQIDGLIGQVGRSDHQTMGVFLAVNGWSNNVIALLKQNPEKRILLMDGYDLRCVLSRQMLLRRLLTAKISALNFKGEPFCSAVEVLQALPHV